MGDIAAFKVELEAAICETSVDVELSVAQGCDSAAQSPEA